MAQLCIAVYGCAILLKTCSTAVLLWQMQAALGSPEVQEITINLTLKYVLVALVAGTSQKRFQEFQPDFIKLKSVFSQEQVTGVIVTCAGQMHLCC